MVYSLTHSLKIGRPQSNQSNHKHRHKYFMSYYIYKYKYRVVAQILIIFLSNLHFTSATARVVAQILIYEKK